MDVFETEKALVVRMELAGVSSPGIRVTVDGDWLIVRGERRPFADSDARRLHRMEIAFGPFERRLRMPADFEGDQVSANLEEGFLTVVLPKRLPASRRIEIRRDEEPQE